LLVVLEMSDQEASRAGAYALAPARKVEHAALSAFAQTIWPGRPPERLLSSWWMRADDSCAVAAVHQPSGAVAALCAGRPSEWAIGGQIYSAVAICDWYVSPAHQARMLGRRVVRHFTAPGRMMYAFSMSDDAIAYLARLGWVGPYTSSLLALPLPRLARLAHACLARRSGIDLRDHAVAPGALPAPLAADLDRIEAARTGHALPHMRRGAAEWSWRLSVCGERSYRFSVARRGGEPVGYIAVRRLTPGTSRLMGRLPGAMVTDLVTVDDDARTLRALIARGAASAGELGAVVVSAATTDARHRQVLATMGFLSPGLPWLGRYLERHAPQYMWLPREPAALLTADALALSFADSDVDFKL
jgi:hypothetical protein